MNVLLLSPGFPDEMSSFARGLAAVGARVFGVGEQPGATLPGICREALSAYLSVPSMWDEDDVVERVTREVAATGTTIDRVESLWEPLMVLAARLREALGAPGMTVAQTVPFRDKEAMKRVLDEAGLRTPRHESGSTPDEIRAAAERIGYPLIVKPIDGAGSAHTHRCDDDAGLELAIADNAGTKVVSIEEFIEGEEFTFDTICAGGEIAFYNVSWYRPQPLIARTVQWISPQTVSLRDPDAQKLAPGVALGKAVIKALGYTEGYTHMEWFLTPSGEAVFGEIGARAPGARSVAIMNLSAHIDCFEGWAEAVCHGRFSQPIRRLDNAAVICKRAMGEGRIQRIDGLHQLLSRYGQHISEINLLPVGAHRRNWKQTLLSDGYLIVRHPDLDTCLSIADQVGTDIQLVAG